MITLQLPYDVKIDGNIIYGLIFAIICAGVLFDVYKVMSDKTKLNITEKKYITDNASTFVDVQ